MNAVASSVHEAGFPLEITVCSMEKTGISNELASSASDSSRWKQSMNQ